MSEIHRSAAEGDFTKARTREFLDRISDFLSRERSDLLPLREVMRMLKPSAETYRGLDTVPVDRIVGSEGRYRDFSSRFLPRREHLKSRWVSVDMAHRQDIILPPVRLYRIGGVYFVRDGNHRVSVARLQGQLSIDAEVTDLASEIDIDPDMNLDEIRGRVVAWERRLFYHATEYDLVTGCQDLDFSSPGRFDLIMEHILVHKYYINQNRKDELDFGAALLSWHREVYLPIVAAVRENGIMDAFPGRTVSDLYVYVSAHWSELKSKYGVDYDIGSAARDYRRRFGRAERIGIGGLLRHLFGNEPGGSGTIEECPPPSGIAGDADPLDTPTARHPRPDAEDAS